MTIVVFLFELTLQNPLWSKKDCVSISLLDGPSSLGFSLMDYTLRQTSINDSTKAGVFLETAALHALAFSNCLATTSCVHCQGNLRSANKSSALHPSCSPYLTPFSARRLTDVERQVDLYKSIIMIRINKQRGGAVRGF